jgi:hypothetical protein
MTKKQHNAKIKAMRELVKTGELTTKLLAPLGISFESFLKLAQRSDSKEIVAKLVAKYRQELVVEDSGRELLREMQKDLEG